MFNRREENWICYIANLGEPYDSNGAELAKVADRLGVDVDDLADFVEAARALMKKIQGANKADEPTGAL